MHPTLLRMGTVLIALGLLLYFGLGLRHPSQARPGDSPAAFREYAADSRWVTTHLGQFGGFLFVLWGIITLQRVIMDERGVAAALAWIGFAGITATTAVLAMLQAVDGVALKRMVDLWAAAPPEESQAAFRVAESVRWVEIGLNGLMRMLLGLSVLATGLGQALSRLRFRRMGWLGAIAGGGLLAGGVVTAQQGFSPQAAQLGAFFFLFLLWTLVIAIGMWRGLGQTAA